MLRTTSSDDDDTSYYQVPSPLRSHNEQDKQDERESMMSQNGSRRRRAKQSSGDNFYEKTTKSTTSKVFKVFFNTIVLLGVISFSAMFCLLIIAVVIENESSNQQGNKSPIDINLSLLKSHWERLKDRASLVYIASIKPLSSQDQQYNVSRRRRQGKISKVELGKTLLQNADPVGAETLCKAQINHGNLEHFEFVNALICLAEARLALHNAEWNMGVLESEHGLMYERLYLAKNNFDEAVSIEPTNLRARLGLGLVNYLIATREQPDSSSQLLFNSILHFEAVSVLASNTEQDNGIEWIPEEEKEQMRISATYNNGLAHLALGKVKASIPLLTKAYNLLDNDTKVGQGISSITTNLGAALLQRGAYEQAITVMNYSEVMKYCTDVQFQISDTDELSYVKQNYLNKQCSILLNNLSVAGEIEIEIGKTSYPTLAQATSNSEFSLSEWSILHEEKLGGQSFVKTDVLAKETKTQKLAVGEKESFVEVLLYEKENDPVYNDLADEGESSISINDLLSRSQTALEQNDINMAIDTIKKALDIAKEHNEVIACTKALQNALNTGISTGDENEASSVDTLRDEKILRLEHEILKLKIELLKESSIESSTNSNIESVKIRTIDIDSIDNEPSEDTQVTQDDDGRIQVVVDSNENKSVDSNVQKVDKSKAAPNQLQDPNDESIAEDNTDENVENVENVENANDFNETDLSESTITDELSKSSINEMSKEEETKSVKIRTIAIDSIDYNKSPEDTQDTQNDDSRIEVVDDSDENESVDNDVQIDDDLVVNEISENTPIEVISSDVTKQSNDVVDEKSSDNDEPQEVLSTETHDLVANEISENLSIEDINSITKQPSDAVDERSSDNDESQVLSSETHDSVGNEISENTPIEVISSDVTKQSNDVVDERSSDNDEPQVLSNESQSEEEVDLPELFTAPKIEAGPTDPTSLGYMKLADAYIQKKNYLLASKQFQKVLKKSPKHIPALLGYATSMERYAKPKQMGVVVELYTNVTIAALEQNTDKLAEATFRRAIAVSERVEGERLGVLKFIASFSFSNNLGAEIYYEIGSESLKSASLTDDAIHAFKISKTFASKSESEYYSKSVIELAKLSFHKLGKVDTAKDLIDSVLTQNLKEMQVDAYVLSGEIKEKLLDVIGAIEDYQKAITFPESESTATAYYNLGIALKSQEGDPQIIENHIEMALNLGIDPTPAAIDILGEDHIAVIKSIHRAEWNQYQNTALTENENSSRGGIMSGSGVSSNSIFSAKETVDNGEENVDTLSMLEQGAVSYDGSSVPTGDEGLDSEASTLPNQQRSSRQKVNTAT